MKKFIHAIQVQVKPLHHDLNVFINVFIFFIGQNVFCILVEHFPCDGQMISTACIWAVKLLLGQSQDYCFLLACLLQ